MLLADRPALADDQFAGGEVTPPTRPVLRYHGGKWRLARWIIGHFPEHRIYVEPFGGGGSVLIRKPRSYAEVYNDLDGDVVNVFRVLRDPERAQDLRRALELTPFSRADFRAAYGEPADEVERARFSIVRAFMGFGSASTYRGHVTGFRSACNRSGTTAASDWAGWPAQIPAYVARLRGVVVENRDALDVIRKHDGQGTLFYVDPPYPHSTRSRRGHATAQVYPHEMADSDHRALAAALRAARGMVVLSGYACDLYDGELYADWRRVEVAARADGALSRTEVLWLNKACAARLPA